MNDDQYWAAVSTLRLRLAEVLDSLSADEWAAPSLCEDWRVSDVAGHLSCVPTITAWQLIAAAPRGRFDMNRVNTVVARRYASLGQEQVTDRIRKHADDRRTSRLLDTRNSLFDLIVHSQDITLPLGRTFAVHPELAAQGLARVWEMGMPFHARKRFAGLSLRATDADLALGSDAAVEVTGPALALLLLATGRTEVARPHLTGDGVSALS